MGNLDRKFPYTHLNWEYTWRGMTLTHIFFGVLAPAAIFLVVNFLVGLAVPEVPYIVWIFPSLACIAGLVGLQYKKDRNFMVRHFFRLVTPKSFTPFKADNHPPFPVPQDVIDG